MRYLDILADQVHLAMSPFYSDDDGYFMDDNAPIHRARSVQNWFAEHQSNFQHLSWPLHSPDLMWSPSKMYGICWKDASDSTLLLYLIYKNLKSCIANAWYSLDVNALQKLVNSLSKWIRAVIGETSGPIKYWSWVSNSLVSVCILSCSSIIDVKWL